MKNVSVYHVYCNSFNNISAVNYVAVSEALGTSPSVLAAGLAADNVICAIYFTTIFALASKISPEDSTPNKGTSIFCYNSTC